MKTFLKAAGGRAIAWAKTNTKAAVTIVTALTMTLYGIIAPEHATANRDAVLKIVEFLFSVFVA